jgi:hypothetical protein
MKCVSGVAPGAAKIAAREAHEYAGQSRAGAFSLNGFEDFSNDHGRKSALELGESAGFQPREKAMPLLTGFSPGNFG